MGDGVGRDCEVVIEKEGILCSAPLVCGDSFDLARRKPFHLIVAMDIICSAEQRIINK